MRIITKEELDNVLEKHMKWLKNEKYGERADLSGTTLSGADLSGTTLSGANLSRATLSGANLFRANLSKANLSKATLSGADLLGANLSKATLSGADLLGADLSGTNLSKATLSGADLLGADLSGANLSGTTLSGANLSRATLSGANLSGADLLETKNIPYIPMYCPCEGSFIGWKKAILQTEIGVLIKLEILEDSLRSSATTEKCRCNKAKVLKITSLDEKHEYDEAFSMYDKNFIYKVGETVSVDNFCEDRFNECAPGIHFFINKQTAINYI